jgi:NADP-dependent 3-hydroxy acid dehydrogenase YdfG
MSSLNGKTALITGGGSGIGLEVARGFLKEGVRVVIAGRNPEKLQRAAQGLAGGERLTTHTADVSDPGQVKSLVEAALRQLGRIDLLVNNAGTNIKDREFRKLTVESWQRLVRSNLDGAFYCLHAVLPQMLQRRDGLIINICSIAGKRAIPLSGVGYAASKFGMSALGLGVAAEEKDSGIRVSNIYPGEVDTPILEVRPTPLTEEHRRQILKAEDVAAAVLFVAKLPPHVSVPELVIKPTTQFYV